MLSVVIPAYNEEKMVSRASEVIASVLKENDIAYEIIFVNDGSNDSTWNEIKTQISQCENVKGISFSRNFGKEAAIFAGLSECKGECAVVIDCDLQHPPQKIIEMYQLWKEGYEIIEGRKNSRGKENPFHGYAAKIFYKMISNATGVDMQDASDYRLMDRKVITALINMTEHDAFFRALSSWVGFKTKEVYYDVAEREAGESKWSTKSLVKYAMINISSFTSFPLQVVTILGIVMLIMSVVLSAETLIKWGMNKAVEGFTTMIIMQCFTGSILMISLGIIGYYISKIYASVQNRPRYIISERQG